MIKRPIVIACIGYIIGIILGLYKINIALIFLAISISIAITRILDKRTRKYLKILFPKNAIIIFLVFIIIGLTYILILNNKYNKIYKIKGEIEVIGIIENIELREYSNKYIIKVKSIDNKKCIDIKLLLYTQRDEKVLEYGDYIKLKAEYTVPEGSRNYKGFSYKNYLKQNSIYGNIKAVGEIQVLQKEKVSYINKIANNIRNKVISEANSNLSKDASSVFLGILIGEKSQISEEINTYFRQGNMAHILAVSGAHVSYIICFLGLIFKNLQKKYFLISIIIVLSFFMILTNCSPSVTRACIMAIIAIIAQLVHRKSDIYNNLSISSLLILFFNPYIILNIGFILTYFGTIGIVLLNKKISKLEHKQSIKNTLKDKFKKFIINSIVISLSVQILIAPIILYNFNTISYNFLISGIISTPIFAMIMIIGCLIIVLFPIKSILFPIIEILVNLLIFISKFLSNLPFSTLRIPTPNIAGIISYYIILFTISFSKTKIVLRILKSKTIIKKVLKIVIVIMFIIYFSVYFTNKFTSKGLRIYFIDVGQGDSSLVITPKNKIILIDGGGSSDEKYDIGKNILVPYLLDRGISSIDYIMVSHFDNDHSGGLMYVLETLKVKNILVSEQVKTTEEYKNFMQLVKEKNINTIVVKQGDIVNIEKDLKIYILYPKSTLKFNDLNNNSIVAKLVYKDFSMLYTGDIESEAENEVIQKYGKDILKSTVLKVAHHGSKTSSTEAFINLVAPKIALIGVGKDNNFGHPSNITLKNLEEINCRIYRTDECGEIEIKVNNKNKMYISSKLCQ